MSISQLLRHNIKTLVPYQSARRMANQPKPVQLNANESPPFVQLKLRTDTFNRYPEPQPQRLRIAYARYANVSPSQVLITRGADEGIALIIQSFCEPGKDAIAITPPTYGMYEISARTAGVEVTPYPLTGDTFRVDTDTLIQVPETVKVVFLCSPNNPVGSTIPISEISQLAKSLADRAIVVVDEAYVEFSNCSAIALVREHANLVILRTLSKAFALAALRIGFVIANEEIIEVLSRVIAPYPIPQPCYELAECALTQDALCAMRNNVSQIKAYCDELSRWFARNTPYTVISKSAVNFITVRVPDKARLLSYLANHGVLVRDQSYQVSLENCLRITIGTPNELAQLKQSVLNFLSRSAQQ